MKKRYKDISDDGKKYRIIRFTHAANGRSQVIKRHLTKFEARTHCQRYDSHGDGWFDAYREEKKHAQR